MKTKGEWQARGVHGGCARGPYPQFFLGGGGRESGSVHSRVHRDNKTTLAGRAHRAKFPPIFPQLSPFFPIFCPVLGTPEKAGVM